MTLRGHGATPDITAAPRARAARARADLVASWHMLGLDPVAAGGEA